MSGIGELREKIHPGNTDKGDGKRISITLWSSVPDWLMTLLWFSYLRPHIGRPDDHHGLQETKV